MIDAYENDPDISNEDYLRKQNRHLNGRCSVLWEALYEANNLLSEEVSNRRFGGGIGGDGAWKIAKINFFDIVLWESPKNMPPCDKRKRKELIEDRERPDRFVTERLAAETCAREMLLAARRTFRLLNSDDEVAESKVSMARKILFDALKEWS